MKCMNESFTNKQKYNLKQQIQETNVEKQTNPQANKHTTNNIN